MVFAARDCVRVAAALMVAPRKRGKAARAVSRRRTKSRQAGFARRYPAGLEPGQGAELFEAC